MKTIILQLIAIGVLLYACNEQHETQINNNTITLQVHTLSGTQTKSLSAEDSITEAKLTEPQTEWISIEADSISTENIYIQEQTFYTNSAVPNSPLKGVITSKIDRDFAIKGHNPKDNGVIIPFGKASPNGILEQRTFWPPTAKEMRYYAIHPYNDQIKSENSISFEPNSDILKQTDLHIATGTFSHSPNKGQNVVIPITFKPILTAVQFIVGNTPLQDVSITQIAFKNVYTKGVYRIDEDSWEPSTINQYTLKNIQISDKNTPDEKITNDEQTFLLVPQTLPQNAKIEITLSDGRTLSSNIEGRVWKPGTVVKYRLAIPRQEDNREYFFNATEESRNNVNGEVTANIKVVSYSVLNGVEYDEPWTIVGYSTSDEPENITQNIPDWSTINISEQTLKGGKNAPSFTSKLSLTNGKDFIDQKAIIDQQLTQNPTKGSPAIPFDLSTHDPYGNSYPQTTANCYPISANGWYAIPLVYGAAIVDGKEVPEAYEKLLNYGYYYTYKVDHLAKQITTGDIVQHLKTHNNPKALPASAQLLWATQNGVVTDVQLKDNKIIFRVQNIKQGNALIGITDGDGNIAWSWHLWFTPASSLDPISVVAQRYADRFLTFEQTSVEYSRNPVGLYYREWGETSFRTPRAIRIHARMVNNPQITQTIVVEQPPYNSKIPITTRYQNQRKDPFLISEEIRYNSTGNGRHSLSEYFTYETQYGSYSPNSIKLPGIPYIVRPSEGWISDVSYWDNSSEDTDAYNPDIKSVYDPLPPLFKVMNNASPYFDAFQRSITTEPIIIRTSSSIYSVSATNLRDDRYLYNPSTGDTGDAGYFIRGKNSRDEEDYAYLPISLIRDMVRNNNNRSPRVRPGSQLVWGNWQEGAFYVQNGIPLSHFHTIGSDNANTLGIHGNNNLNSTYPVAGEEVTYSEESMLPVIGVRH